ncbi:four-carbon acid sugar kinase family protein [Microbacterium kribbense]|uniref:Four-carbon acid sugar kinase family protein n=1 Tax=Microbacterium kribbense TaxID=433645 RepID=A0ABP7G757_9MICO
MSDAQVAFYGDDFTGSVDALLQFVRSGLTGQLFVGLPPGDALRQAADECDVIGIAGISRSLGTAELDAEVRPVLEALAALHPAVVQYKACSTADSAPSVGSLGRVIEIARDVFGSRPVPLLFAQPDFGRYTAFGHHFAAEGGRIYRLDRQPTMSNHPTTPMTESDLALHLARQTSLPIGGISFTEYTSAHALTERLRDASEAGVVLDALDGAQVALVGHAVAGLPATAFAIGSGGLSLGLGQASPRSTQPGARGTITRLTTPGAVLVVSGSRSAQTRRQADAAARAGWHVEPLRLPADEASLERVAAVLRSGTSVVLTSDDADVPAAGTLMAIATAAAAFVDEAVRRAGVRRVIVCGGDASSRITRLLGVESLSIAANPWGNVVLLRAGCADPQLDGLELLLKGGQVGAQDLFDKVRTLGS